MFESPHTDKFPAVADLRDQNGNSLYKMICSGALRASCPSENLDAVTLLTEAIGRDPYPAYDFTLATNQSFVRIVIESPNADMRQRISRFIEKLFDTPASASKDPERSYAPYKAGILRQLDDMAESSDYADGRELLACLEKKHYDYFVNIDLRDPLPEPHEPVATKSFGQPLQNEQ